MFNLLVSGSEEEWTGQPCVMDAARYLEHTSDTLRTQFPKLNDETIEILKASPALFAYELGIQRPARLGRITEVLVRGSKMRIAYELEPAPLIAPEALAKLEWELDLGERELYRTHWALKRGDLFRVLDDANLLAGTSTAQREGTARQPTRAEILDAAARLQPIGHSAFDRMLLEFGIDALDAGRGRGGLQDRANALAEFAIRNPEARTAEGRPIRAAIMDYAGAMAPSMQDERPVGAASKSRSEPVVELPANPQSAPQPTTGKRAKVFVVHGRENGSKHELARFLEKLGLEAVILHEQPNRGRTLIAKFQEVAADIHYAVVLMTADDEGGLRGHPSAPRARQNVVFELGFFIGKLGADRVCALVSPEVERPSDFEAVVYVAFGDNTPWKNELARELYHAGLPIDPHKLF